MKIDPKVLLSTLWIFAVLNYLYADVLSMYEPGVISELMTGSIQGISFTPVFLLFAAVLMETAIVMVILSRVLEYKWNRITNIIAGIIHTLAVFMSTFVGTPSLYMFFGIIEIATTSFIVWYAWKWRN
jgi:hypothetical protein